MGEIYRVTIRGRTLESRDVRSLLRRAVEEKRNMDRSLRFCGALPGRSPREETPDISASHAPRQGRRGSRQEESRPVSEKV